MKFLIGIAISGLLALTGASAANAASPYDGTVHKLNNLILKDQYGSEDDIDITNRWTGILLGLDTNGVTYNGLSSGDKTSLQNAVNNGRYSVSQTLKGGSSSLVYVTWDDTNSVSLTTCDAWVTSGCGPHQGFKTNGGKWTQITLYGSNIEVSSLYSGSNIITSNVDNESAIGVLLSTYPVTYPDGYIGTEIPDTAYTAPNWMDYWVNFTYSNSNNYVTAKYLNKVTDPPSSASDPVRVTWKLWVGGSDETNGGTQVCEITKLRADLFNQQTDCATDNIVIDKTIDYYISAEVVPTYGGNEALLPDGYSGNYMKTVAKIDFSKSSAGSTATCETGALGLNESKHCIAPDSFDVLDCFQGEYPYININECTSEFNVFFSNLLFGGISFPELNFEPACHQMGTIGSWMQLPAGYTVCPQVSSNVRAVVTPFIAFLLGIVTLGFIRRRSGDFNG